MYLLVHQHLWSLLPDFSDVLAEILLYNINTNTYTFAEVNWKMWISCLCYLPLDNELPFHTAHSACVCWRTENHAWRKTQLKIIKQNKQQTFLGRKFLSVRSLQLRHSRNSGFFRFSRSTLAHCLFEVFRLWVTKVRTTTIPPK